MLKILYKKYRLQYFVNYNDPPEVYYRYKKKNKNKKIKNKKEKRNTSDTTNATLLCSYIFFHEKTI